MSRPMRILFTLPNFITAGSGWAGRTDTALQLDASSAVRVVAGAFRQPADQIDVLVTEGDIVEEIVKAAGQLNARFLVVVGFDQPTFSGEVLAELTRLREAGGLQSYPSRTKDVDDVDFSTGSVGLGVAMTLFASLTQDLLFEHGLWPEGRRKGRMVARVVPNARTVSLRPIVLENVAPGSIVSTDELRSYGLLTKDGYRHGRVNHAQGEYARYVCKSLTFHTNTVEGFFSILKRGLNGIYHNVSEAHLHRYLAEFDFRYNNRVRLGVGDSERADMALAGIRGKRLTYRAAG